MNILVTIPCEEEQAALLRDAAPGAEFRFKGASSQRSPADGLIGGQAFAGLLDEGPVMAEDVAWADGILGNVDPALLGENAKRLQWLQTFSAGVESYVKPGVLPQGCRLTNATGAYGLAISEHMLGMLLMLMKKLELYRDAQKQGSWLSQGAVRSLYGATVLVLGLGDIGGEFARRCRALGARVIGLRRSPGEKPDCVDEIYLTHDLDALLPQADVVAVTLPGTEQTRGLLNRERIAAMKHGAYLLNVGRGFIVDTQALREALESGHLAGAGLDVTDPEPLPAEHPLWQIPTAVVTPHISGYYYLAETYRRIVAICTENLRRFAGGEPLRNEVDFAAGYRRR